ncbi:MAG: helicase-exonuclease AddAB subunit AddA [Clostridia bacterium]|nr:helicase-exonuclease AddAB subunit AddA [Clostridia bacterium]
MSKKWTENQLKAVEARGMQVLVSAAAGSGKTTVLTERVKNILSDTDNPCSVSEILVVTFTRAAATEMRDRIFDALKAEVNESGERSEYLRRQMVLLPAADICTIDSFCSKIVRENFSAAGVGVDFRLLDEKDAEQMVNDALTQVIEDLYEENDDAFRSLTTMFLNERDDKLLGNVIKSLYKYSRSYPCPEFWLKNVCDSFDENRIPNETAWADIIYKYLILFCDFYVKRLNKCVRLMEEAGNFKEDYFKRFTGSAENLVALKTSAENKNWDACVSLIREGLVVKFPARNTKVDENVKEIAKEVFSELEKDVEGLLKRTLPTTEEHKEDCKKLYPVVKKLCEAVKRLGDCLDAIKKENNTYAFDDVLHKCIDLLVRFDDDKWSLTPLAEELRSKYKEILIDEYQDTNEAQNMIFTALSDECRNLYCVGDVKQSIYRFRLASPELFMELRRSLSDYDGSKKPSQITLDKNFRSREGIDEAVNFVFSRLMSETVGEIDYNEREKLSFGADYYPEKNTPDAEIICIDAQSQSAAEAVKLEAQTIADYIERVLNSKVTITTRDGERAVRPSDFCVLLRSTKNKIDVYTDAIKEKGIPTSAVLDCDISKSKEIQLLISLIKVINNPLEDIPLIAVLQSPLFGFTADELAEIRMIDRYADFYVCLERFAESSIKAKGFLEKLRVYRNISASLPIDEFVRFIVDDTAISDIYLAVSDGAQRASNIRTFVNISEKFTDNGKQGLGAFVRYIDNMADNEALRSSGVDGMSDGVQFMSIHKSKGLEFPYVIIADLSKGFNKQDSYNSLTLSRETAIGLKIRDDERFTRYHTLSSVATEKSILFSSASEELRVLYVAMTRAKEHLTFICTINGKACGKRIGLNNLLSLNGEGRIHPYAVYRSGSMCEWVLSCFASHEDCGIVRDISPYKGIDFKECGFNVDTAFIEYDETDDEAVDDVAEISAPVDEALLNTINERINYKYSYDCSGILAKITASSTEKTRATKEYFAKSKPHFISEGFSAADRGTAIHKFLELCDFKNACRDIESEKQRLLKDCGMTEDEISVLDADAIKCFFNSSVGQRLLRAEKVYKEYEFSYFKKSGDIYREINENISNESIVVQGKFDCAFIENGKGIIIDYKSDNITDENVFKEIYGPQIAIYTEALKLCEGIDVSEKYIYSFKLKKFISL